LRLDAIVQCTLIDNAMIDARDNRDVGVLNNTNVLIILNSEIKSMTNQCDWLLIEYTRGASRCCLNGVWHQSSSTRQGCRCASAERSADHFCLTVRQGVKQYAVAGCTHVYDDVLHYSVEAQSCGSLLCCCDDVDVYVTLREVHVIMMM
jgi:hypothetical protein